MSYRALPNARASLPVVYCDKTTEFRSSVRLQRTALRTRRLAAPDNCLARPTRSARSSLSGTGGLPSFSAQHGGLVRSAVGVSARPASCIELRVDIHERIFVIMRADQKDRGNVVRSKCDDCPERPGKMRDADLGQKIVARNPVVKRCATMCAQGEEELVIGSPLFLAQLADLLCGPFRNEGACRRSKRLPAITAPFAFFVGSEGRTYIARIHLRQAFRQIRPVQQRLVLQPIPQIVTEVPVLACGPQVVQEAQDGMQTLRVQEQAWPHRS